MKPYSRPDADQVVEARAIAVTGLRPILALSAGSAAIGALAVGAIAIGALRVGALSVGRAKFERLEIDELIVRRLEITEGGSLSAGSGA